MNKYTNGKIYRLVCNITGLNYYGSTVQPLHKRKYEHKQNYELYMKNKNKEGNKYKLTTSSKIIEGDNYDIILVEDFPCENKKQLETRERYFIENNDCVNKIIPRRTIKEWYADNKEYKLKCMKEYRDMNKDKIKEYRDMNKDKIKEYRDMNKDKIKEYRAKYKEAVKQLKEDNKI